MLASFACLQRAGQGGAVDRGDDQHLGALGHHVVDLGDLGRDVVVGVLEVDLVAVRLELGLHRVAVLDPALEVLVGIATPMVPLVPPAMLSLPASAVDARPQLLIVSASAPVATRAKILRTVFLRSMVLEQCLGVCRPCPHRALRGDLVRLDPSTPIVALMQRGFAVGGQV